MNKSLRNYLTSCNSWREAGHRQPLSPMPDRPSVVAGFSAATPGLWPGVAVRPPSSNTGVSILMNEQTTQLPKGEL